MRDAMLLVFWALGLFMGVLGTGLLFAGLTAHPLALSPIGLALFAVGLYLSAVVLRLTRRSTVPAPEARTRHKGD